MHINTNYYIFIGSIISNKHNVTTIQTLCRNTKDLNDIYTYIFYREEKWLSGTMPTINVNELWPKS